MYPRIRDMYVMIALGVIACVVIFLCNKSGDDFKQNGLWATGKVTSVYYGRGGMNIDYVFNYKEKQIAGSDFFFISIAHQHKFENKTFPVFFSSKHPDRNRLMIQKKDYEDFDMPFPDSLQWVEGLHDALH